MNDPNDTDDRSSGEIERDIRQRRQQMDSTLDELGERLTLRSLVHSALDWWEAPADGRGNAAAKRACLTVGRQIKHHPMPSLLIGGGIAWLLSETAGDEDEVEKTRNGTLAGAASGLANAKDAAVEAMGDAKDRVAGAAGKIHDKADHLAHEAVVKGRESVRKVGNHLADGYRAGAERFSKAADEYPLALGAAFAALGVLAGLALPRTRKEDELMGEQSDHVMEAAKEKGEHALEAGKAIGERVIEAVKDEAAAQGLSGETVKDGLDSLTAKAAAVVGKAKEEAIHAARDEGLEIPAANETGEENPTKPSTATPVAPATSA
jgi:hypothetical protein